MSVTSHQSATRKTSGSSSRVELTDTSNDCFAADFTAAEDTHGPKTIAYLDVPDS